MDTPVIFCDGTEVYERLGREYIRHNRGLFILAPSGTGKTYYVKHQTEKHWIDGDDLWDVTNADPTGSEWDNDDIEVIHEVDRRCDVMTEQAKKQGFWVLGSSNSFLRPDAIVLPPWDEHVHMIRMREENDYDGGATSADLEGVQEHREIIQRWEAEGVPRFDSISDAVEHLATDAG